MQGSNSVILRQRQDNLCESQPCCHQVKTPCVDKIISFGIRKVYISIEDPDRRVSGKGIQLLKDAGIKVHKGLCEKESKELNRSFIHRNITDSAFGVLKWAMSMDGRVGLKNGKSKWITSEDSDPWSIIIVV